MTQQIIHPLRSSKLKTVTEALKESAHVINITNTRKVSFSELVAQYLCDMTPAGEETYLQGNVL